MKTEPLKNKWSIKEWKENLELVKKDDRLKDMVILYKTNIEMADEIKSAVEWLKQELSKEPINYGGDEHGHKLISINQIKYIINEAFEDVMEK